MNLWQLIFKEILFRKTAFLLGLFCVIIAISGLVGSVTLLNAHNIRTEQILAQRERETRKQMQEMEDDYRRIMRDMGYNVMIYPGEQSLAMLRSKGYPDTFMPYEYVQRLARGRIETLNHLLPVLQKGIRWEEFDIDIILSGTPGQVPIYHKPHFLTEDGTQYRNPIMPPIPSGKLILGSSIAADIGKQAGEKVMLNGIEFEIARINPPEGTTDDIAVWCDLETAQQIVGIEDKINIILALECVCTPDALGVVTQEVQNLLPNVQVTEFSSRARARALARDRAEQAHIEAIEAEAEHRRRIHDERRMFAAILVPLLMAGAGLWIFFLILANVRERKTEIGILRAIGVKESKIMAVFLLKAVIIGVLGALIGYFAGLAIGSLWAGIGLFTADFARLLSLQMFIASLLTAPAICAIAGWLPAIRAARQDPAVVLKDE